jgi:DNA (cytosine-5)-methyltransferase 1
MIAATLFSGGGLADIGLVAAGYTPVWAIEHHQPAADIYQCNFGHDSLNDLLTAAPADYPAIDYLHLSPPCQSFSGANKKPGEKKEDLTLSQKSADFIHWHQPERLSIENVPAYKDSESFALLMKTINAIYPYHTIDTLDLATFGVPQNRRRLIIRAAFDPIEPLYLSQTHSHKPGLLHRPLNNWYDAIADLIPQFKERRLTDKQVQAIDYFKPTPPFLIECVGARRKRGSIVRSRYQPCWTILASRGGDVRSGNRTNVIDVVTEDGLCRSLNLRAVARLMSCPDTYQIPEGAQWHECWRVLGNGVPPLAMQAIAQSFRVL